MRTKLRLLVCALAIAYLLIVSLSGGAFTLLLLHYLFIYSAILTPGALFLSFIISSLLLVIALKSLRKYGKDIVYE